MIEALGLIVVSMLALCLFKRNKHVQSIIFITFSILVSCLVFDISLVDFQEVDQFDYLNTLNLFSTDKRIVFFLLVSLPLFSFLNQKLSLHYERLCAFIVLGVGLISLLDFDFWIKLMMIELLCLLQIASSIKRQARVNSFVSDVLIVLPFLLFVLLVSINKYEQNYIVGSSILGTFILILWIFLRGINPIDFFDNRESSPITSVVTSVKQLSILFFINDTNIYLDANDFVNFNLIIKGSILLVFLLLMQKTLKEKCYTGFTLGLKNVYFAMIFFLLLLYPSNLNTELLLSFSLLSFLYVVFHMYKSSYQEDTMPSIISVVLIYSFFAVPYSLMSPVLGDFLEMIVYNFSQSWLLLYIFLILCFFIQSMRLFFSYSVGSEMSQKMTWTSFGLFGIIVFLNICQSIIGEGF